MRHVRIGDLSSVDINWKMLTLARPTTKIDEDIFSKYFFSHNFKPEMLHCLFRLVELDKLRIATRKEEAKDLAAKGGVDPNIIILPPSANKGGVSEKLVKVAQTCREYNLMFILLLCMFQVCEECKEEFCTGTCIIFQYDSYQVGKT